MKFNKSMLLGFGLLVILLAGQTAYAKQGTPIPTQLPVKGMITMIDLGATECIPCKMMAPVMKEVEEEYRDRAAIVFIDVWKNEGMAPKFGVRTIPTQIFYDHTGKEVYRHEGFLDKKSVVSVLTQLGVTPGGPFRQDSVPMNTTPPGFPQGPLPAQPPQQMVYPQTQAPQPGVYQAGQFQPGIQPGGQYPTGAPGGIPNGLLTPGMANLLFLDTNVSQPKEEVMNVLSEIERQYQGKVTLFMLDANANQDMVRNLGVQTVPVLIIYDQKGKEAMKYAGIPNLKAVQNVLSKIVK